MVTINAGGVSEGVFESELFGHVKGAFTDAKQDRVGRFELADGSTLFLDEIANVPMSQQQKLLRVLETGEFERLGTSRTRKADVRLVSATNADVNAEVAAGRFRQDLLFRLNTIEIHLPPLRERREDIPRLARHFLAMHAQRYHKSITGFDPATMQALVDHHWPGNVRELDHAVERAVLMAQGNVIHASDLGLRAAGAESASRLEEMSLEDVEAFLIRKAMARYGNVSHAARALGLSRSALYRRLERHRPS
jgi:DNA-binding NtrC family response regulator